MDPSKNGYIPISLIFYDATVIAARNLQVLRIHTACALLGKHFQEPLALQINVKTINARETQTECQQLM